MHHLSMVSALSSRSNAFRRQHKSGAAGTQLADAARSVNTITPAFAIANTFSVSLQFSGVCSSNANLSQGFGILASAHKEQGRDVAL
jgi:hypothetical protein